MKAAIVFYRTLSSQSAASVSAGYIAAYLRDKGIETTLNLIKKEKDKEDTYSLLNHKFDLIFYKINFKDLDRFENNIYQLKKAMPEAKIILFGPLPYINADILLKQYPDIYGIMKPNTEEFLPEDKCFITRNSSSAAEKNIYEFKYTLFPARDIENTENLKIVNLEASRGCSHACSFCHVGLISKLTGQKPAQRSCSDTVKEISELAKNGKKYFIFNDAVLGGGGNPGKKWLTDFCSKCWDIKNSIYFMAYLTLNDIKDEDTVKMLSEHNFIRLFVGIESADKSSLSSFNKHINSADYSRIKPVLKAHNITSHIGFILFHPYATKEEIDMGIDFLYDNDEIHRFGVINERARIINRTALYHKASKDGLLSSKDGIAFDYHFYNPEINILYRRYKDTFNQIDIPLLERIEHLFVTAEFIDNLLRKSYIKEVKSYLKIAKLRAEYALSFYKLCKSLNSDKKPDTDHLYYVDIWQKIEAAWQNLLTEARESGLKNPLEWIASGNCDPEPEKNENYDGKTMKTRSGEIRI